MAQIINYTLAFGLSCVLVIYFDTPLAEALLVGGVVGILHTLGDISRALHKGKE